MTINALPKIDETIYFRIREQNLTDGSQVNDVVIVHPGGDTLVLPALSIVDAIKLQQKIWDAVREHTNEQVEYLEDQ